MSLTQQYLLDTYRASRLGVPAPPAPGLEDWQAVRELGGEPHRLRAVGAARAARAARADRADRGTRTAHRLRRALTHLLPRHPGPPSVPTPRPAATQPRRASGPACRPAPGPACRPAGTA
ncbi:hypothetical protein [Streptomyces sp. NPDC085937]|uniref:hypothetical protein n=1 Tax=Streptomyces sp. NPDC085937 TaxID=3365742 RepID=UPI0037D76303